MKGLVKCVFSFKLTYRFIAKKEQLVNEDYVLCPMVRGKVCEDSCCVVKQVLTSFGRVQHKVC